MSQDGEINLNEVKARYSVKDIIFVDAREIDLADEFRLTFEACLSVGLMLLGSILTSFNWYLLLTAIIFLAFGIFSIVRYKNKRKEIKSIK